ncbi:hypothetical protein KSL82_06235 [Limosilactobacillus portuensis]|uniref:DUF2977 domain-containing protein n=1 Tax=Limosilactobacillus portuensis TaxID=2742601 RepID=A0ABS6IW20_9LACO|nr:hypothetical protein [Limosilactobacillus portuensis]MBU9695493.1 hypothetical protein [Limosilactobacillus portuensis]
MKKTVVLTDEVKNEEERTIAQMRVVLNGDGSTPNVMTMGTDNPVGYNDDGTPIFPDVDDNLLKSAQQQMMAEAIKTQKELTKENGGDPSKVNVIGAETDTKLTPTAQQTIQATMMKRIASLQMQVSQLKKEVTKDNGN